MSALFVQIKYFKPSKASHTQTLNNPHA